ncbi:zinc ribbon domain-containing protein [Lentzea sp. NPDC051838]|uniref:zinc ribbon domain-containing protein n=1 Tax=Lentzea sp. NPDC051838 TaxID=3154849 RepID=UPI003432972A
MRTVRTVLAQKIKQRGETLQEFVDFAEAFAREHNEPGMIGKRHLQRLIAGRKPSGQPLAPTVQPATARLLERIFHLGIDDLLSPPEPLEFAGQQQPERGAVELTAALDWLDARVGWKPGTSRSKVRASLAELDLGQLLDRGARRARVGRAALARVLVDYYGHNGVYVQSQLLRRSRAAGGFSAGKKLVRGSKRTKRVYPLRGRVKCGYCTRRMEGTPIGRKTYYRCALRTMVPGSPALNGHPTNVYLPEGAALDRINEWLDRLFAPENVDSTVSALAASQGDEKPGSGDQAAARKRLTEAEAKLRRFQDAIAAGVNPEALVGAINEAEQKRAAAEAELDGMPKRGGRRSVAAIFAMVDSLGDVRSMTRRGEPDELQKLYEKLGLETVYNAEGRILDASIRPSVRDKAGVREGT